MQMCDRQGKRATKKATKVTLNKNKNTSGRGSATKTRKSILSGRHLGHSSINNTLPPGDDLQLCDHCRRMDDYETDSYFNSFHTQKYSRRLPIRIAWSANNTQYNSNFTSDSPRRTMVMFLDDSDTRKVSGSHAGRGRQSSQSLPLAASRSKPADPMQDGCVSSMLWEFRRDPGVRELCRVECEAHHSEKTLVAAHEAGRQNSRAATVAVSSGATKGAQKEQLTDGSLLSVFNLNNNPDAKPEQTNKTTSVDNPSRQSEKSSVAVLDTGLIGQSSIPTAFMQPSDLNYRCKVRTARQPGSVSKGKGVTCLASSAQVEKPSEVKGLHRYAARLN